MRNGGVGGMMYKPRPSLPLHPPQPIGDADVPLGVGGFGECGRCLWGKSPPSFPPANLRCRCPPRVGRCLGAWGLQVCAGVVLASAPHSPSPFVVKVCEGLGVSRCVTAPPHTCLSPQPV